MPMNKFATLNDSSKLQVKTTTLPSESASLKPSGLTMKFVFGYAAALEVIKTQKNGTINVLLN